MTEALEKTNFPIVGTKFRGKHALDFVKTLQHDDHLELKREPTNAYDPNAIAVYGFEQVDENAPGSEGSDGSVHIGYIPQVMNAQLARLMDEGVALRATFDSSEIGKARLNVALASEVSK